MGSAQRQLRSSVLYFYFLYNLGQNVQAYYDASGRWPSPMLCAKVRRNHNYSAYFKPREESYRLGRCDNRLISFDAFCVVYLIRLMSLQLLARCA